MKNSNIELLSPVGDFECLKAAVQNGADSVYFGATSFSARASANNFNDEELNQAITYAKLRGVKTHLTLNTLIKNDEMKDAMLLAKKAYEYGIDAIIVQDLGLAKTIIENFPNLPIHASTQMTLHNLEGVLEVQKLGFKRAVLSRELSLEEITYICNHSDIEIETFIHGALCISYSGQCLFSSMIGGRSGNRGKCAQPCRLPYTLTQNDSTTLDKGYLLSTKDFCGLDFLPSLIETGVMCFKIEGRMKNPEYVATVTRIYRKYIDLALSSKPYRIEEEDRKALMQVFNRGNFSSGHLDINPNKELVFKEKQNHMGLYLGNVANFKEKKGHVFINLNEDLSIGDSISFEKESTKYTVSELMIKEKNYPCAEKGTFVEVGRMKGNIKPGDKVYKIASKTLSALANSSLEQENRKIKLEATIVVKKDVPVKLTVKVNSNLGIYQDILVEKTSSIVPVEAKSKPIEKDRILLQLSKTNNTIFDFETITVNLENNLFLPSISSLNELRREALSQIQEIAMSRILRTSSYDFEEKSLLISSLNKKSKISISLLLNAVSFEEDYTKLENVDNIYVPIKYFMNKDFSSIIHVLEQHHKLYIYLPTIIKPNFSNIILDMIEKAINEYSISGFVISNISGSFLISHLKKKYKNNYEIITNYTLNIFNSYTEKELLDLGVSKLTLSLELNKMELEKLCLLNPSIARELIVYGRTPVMTSAYCLFGQTNKCYPTCPSKCNSHNVFYLKDRLNFNFRVVPDNLQTITTIYNSKITSIDISSLSYECYEILTSLRIDVLEETVDEINNIVGSVIEKRRLEGQNYTNGNFNKEV